MLCALFRLPTPHIRILLRSSSLPGFGLLLLRVPSLFGISMPLWFSPLCCTCCTPLLIVRGSLSRIAQDSVRLVQSLHDRRRVGRRIHIGVVFANQTLVRGLYDLWLGRVVDLQHCVQVVGVPHLTFAGWGHGGPESVGGRRVSLDGVDHDRSQFVDVMAQFIDTALTSAICTLRSAGTSSTRAFRFASMSLIEQVVPMMVAQKAATASRIVLRSDRSVRLTVLQGTRSGKGMQAEDPRAQRLVEFRNRWLKPTRVGRVSRGAGFPATRRVRCPTTKTRRRRSRSAR